MSKVNVRKHNHEYILSGIIKCPLCGRGLVGTFRKRQNKNGTVVEDFYYRCGHGKVAEDGSRCTYSPSWNENQMDGVIEQVLLDTTKDPNVKAQIKAKLDQKVDVTSLEMDRERLREQLKQTMGAKMKLLSMIEKLDVTDRHYERKSQDMQDRLDIIYDKIADIEDGISTISQKIDSAQKENMDANQMYKILVNYGKVYSRMSDFEKKTFFLQFVERIELDPNERDVHKCVKSIKLMFPILVNGVPTDSIQLHNETTVETIVLLERMR